MVRGRWPWRSGSGCRCWPRLFSRPTLAQIAAGSSERGDWMSAAYRQHGYTMRAIAEQAGVHYSLVGKIIRAWEQACATFET